MSPAPRRVANRGLEPNLHTHPKGFRWKNPRTGRYHYLGKSVGKHEANEAARQLNHAYSRKSSIFERIALQESETLGSVIKTHLKQYLPHQRVTENTRKNREYIFGKVSASDLAASDVSTITTRDIVKYLQSLATDNMRQQYRAQLISVFKTAIKEGLIDQNPVLHTDAPHVERQRDRLHVDGYKALYELAEPWLQNLMDLLRLTLQRPDDLLLLKWGAYTGTHLRVVQGKTEARLAIAVSAEIKTVLDRCRDDVVSPFIIHRLPEKLKPREQRSKRREHHTQILRTQASRAFTDILRKCEYFEGHKNPPTLYECKSLGIAEYRTQGWEKERVQRLAGHRNVRMTEHYARGHEAPFDEVGTAPAGGAGFVTETLP